MKPVEMESSTRLPGLTLDSSFKQGLCDCGRGGFVFSRITHTDRETARWRYRDGGTEIKPEAKRENR